ncbi:PREDICTED: GATA transcription factor 11-like isoform X2 [Ipomoea nil]|uniref:GATA transcription factor 11-like isoform X2 n=1 Tax=Ipomoea nil TaxID=35883 RepID=UPI000901A4F1|nr:PREDICTED: GATA transcription factor 11-like isoform X2 [Ipomoea nil]
MMSMVEPGHWDGIATGANGGYDNFHDLLSILDFPMESLEGDGFNDDWDANLQCLGPIPSDALMGLQPVPQLYTGNGSLGVTIKSEASVDNISRQNQLLNYGEKASGAALLCPDKYSDHKSGMFQTQTPTRISENRALYLGKMIEAIKSNFIVPVGTRSKRMRCSKFKPWHFISASTKKKRERKLSQRSIAAKDIRNPQANQAASDPCEQKGRQSFPVKKCLHCEVTKTPQWREGPMGPKTLCNACGVRYRSGRLFPEYRPAASPTFVPSLHSSSHKEVTEMRRKAGEEGVTHGECQPWLRTHTK